MPELVHPILTEPQAGLIHQALIAFLNTPAGDLSENPAEEELLKKELSELVYFFSEVVEHPEGFGLRSKQDTLRIARAHKQTVKGAAQPASGRNKRKARQAKRQSYGKRRRRENKEQAPEYNKANKTMQDEMAEAQKAYEAAQEKQRERLNKLLVQDDFSAEEVQELFEYAGLPSVAAALREARAADDPQTRLDNAAAAATQ